jgi:phage terminase large subunit GpA-like protein
VALRGDPKQREVWQQLAAFLGRTWVTEDGRLLGISCAAVDSSDGNISKVVYDFCRQREGSHVYAVKGKGGANLPPVPVKPSRPPDGQGAALYILGVDGIKSTLVDRLRLEDAGPGYCHLPRDPALGYGQEWFDQMVAERQLAITHGGRTRFEWTLPRGLRNESMDCRVYATAAMEICGAGPSLTPDKFWWES